MVESEERRSKLKIAVYARVSKSDDSQDPENQLVPLREFSKALGAEEVIEYVDLASGGNGERQGFQQIFQDAEQKKFGLLLIWSLDRFSREGIPNTLGYLERLKRNGIAVKSLRESWLDTRDEGLGQLLLAIFSWVAQQERKRIIERTRAGLDRAKKAGKQLGRPIGAKDKKGRRKSGYWLRYASK